MQRPRTLQPKPNMDQHGQSRPWFRFHLRVIVAIMTAMMLFGTSILPEATCLAASKLPTSETLREAIDRIAKRDHTPPIDARIDDVWRAVPDLNGIEVDREASLRRSLTHSQGSNNPAIVYRQVPAKVHLADLGTEPIYRGNPQKRAVSLMINVAWGEEYLPSILHTLREKNVHCTFFLDGSWLKKHEDIAKQIIAQGHELGNHAYSHPDMSRLSVSECERQIDRTNALLLRIPGQKPTLFAPPSGSYNGRVVEVAKSRGMHTILWTADTVDWKRPPTSTIVARVQKRVVPGALVLMHPTAPTAEALPIIIDSLRTRGYQMMTVSHMISPERTLPRSQ